MEVILYLDIVGLRSLVESSETGFKCRTRIWGWITAVNEHFQDVIIYSRLDIRFREALAHAHFT